MKDVAEIRRVLQKLPHALKDDIPPNPPRFRGVARQVTRADLCEIDEGDGHDAPNPRIDVRDLDSLLRDLDESVGQQGIEALAWYHPFHVSANKWGIYIPVTSVHYGAERWFNRRIRRSRRASMALEVLLAHEVMHHACEYAVSQFELLLRAPCWAPARERLKQARLGWFNDEEALANAHSIRKLGVTEPPAIVESLHRALLRSPPGYRDFPAALSDDGFQDHLSEVLRHNVGIPAVDLQTGFFEHAFDPLVVFPDIDDALASCPLFIIDDSRQFDLPPLALRLVPCIPHIVETDRFQKMLRKLNPSVREDWLRMREVLADSVPRYPKFKKLKGGLKELYGIRLNNGFRVHVRPAENGVWEAVEIGPHTAMGHG